MRRPPVGVVLLLAALSGCASRPADFGPQARLLELDEGRFWDAPVQTAPYLDVRMRRRLRAPAREPAVYQGILTMRSTSPAVLRSTFSIVEGSTASFRYVFNAHVAAELARTGQAISYSPAALEVVVACAMGRCRADSKPLAISSEGKVALVSKKILSPARAARIRERSRQAVSADSLKKDNDCALLHDSVKSLDDRDASIRAFTAKFGEAETLAMAKRVRGRYAAEGCRTWLETRGGAGAAWRRVRQAQWKTIQEVGPRPITGVPAEVPPPDPRAGYSNLKLGGAHAKDE